jgi:hypothetical protein
MDFTKLLMIDMKDLISGTKYYIQKIKCSEDDPGTGQQYGIFDRFELYENKITYAVFRETHNFKNPTTKKVLNSGMATGKYEMYCHKKHFIFYEPGIVTYNRKQNELLGNIMQKITNDIHMAKYISKQAWMDIVSSGK